MHSDIASMPDLYADDWEGMIQWKEMSAWEQNHQGRIITFFFSFFLAGPPIIFKLPVK